MPSFYHKLYLPYSSSSSSQSLKNHKKSATPKLSYAASKTSFENSNDSSMLSPPATPCNRSGTGAAKMISNTGSESSNSCAYNDSNTMTSSESNEANTAGSSHSVLSNSQSLGSMLSIEKVGNETLLPKCALSPILSQPKTIRFPAAGLRQGVKRHDGVCYWDKCNKKHESSSKLLDHMQTYHVNTQTGPFSCLWVGCKVYNKESCSRRWLERHVLSHGGSKQFKCIVEGCGLRFGSQLALQKHVNNHFNAAESKESTSKRTSDPPVPKQLRKSGKKLRFRRQPFSGKYCISK